jgi:hypothetical protein
MQIAREGSWTRVNGWWLDKAVAPRKEHFGERIGRKWHVRQISVGAAEIILFF